MPLVSLVRGPADQRDQPGQTTIAGPVTDQAALTSPVTVWIDLGNAAPYSGGGSYSHGGVLVGSLTFS